MTRKVTLIDCALLDGVSAEAAASPRRRRNRNFHPAESDPCNRLLNAIEPDSYVQPHRHLDPGKDETLIVLRGRVGLVVFDDDGEVTGSVALAAEGKTMGVDLRHGTWHTFVGLQPGSVIFEAKAGPYAPLTEMERAPWAPAENAPDANAYLRKLRALFC